MNVDLTDVLVVLAAVLVAIGLYFIAWPLVLVAAGLAVGYVGVRRA